MRRSFVVLLLLTISTSIAAPQSQTIYFKKDHIYAGPGGPEIATVTPLPSDQTAPSVPTGLSTSNVTLTSVQVNWTGATTNADSTLAGFKVYRQQGSGASLPVGTVAAIVGQGSPPATTTTYNFTDQPLTPGTGFTYVVRSFDQSQNHSSASSGVSVTTSTGSDTTAPLTPTALTGYLLTRNSVRLTWNRSIDSGGSGISGYKVYRGGNLISGSNPIANPTYDDTGLSYNTSYAYTITAIDGASNASAATSAFNITTDRELLVQDDFNRPDAALASPWGVNIGSPTFGDGSNYGGPIDGKLKIVGLRLVASTAFPFLSSYYYDEMMSLWIEVPWTPVGVWSQSAIQPSTNSFKASIDVVTSNSTGGLFFYAQSATGQFTDPIGYPASYSSSRGFRAILQSGSVILQNCTDLNYLGATSSVCSTVGSATGVPTTGIVSVETNSSTGSVKVYVNGTLKITATVSTSLMTGPLGGASLGYYDYVSGSPTTYHTATLDNFILERN